MSSMLQAGWFLSECIRNEAQFAAMIDSPPALLAFLHPHGDLRLAPIDVTRLPMVTSLYNAAQTAEQARLLFNNPACAGLIVVDCRQPGVADPWLSRLFGDEDSLLSFASDLDYLILHPPIAAAESDVLATYALEAADRLREWVAWHIGRAERRVAGEAAIRALWDVAVNVDDLCDALSSKAPLPVLTECADWTLEAVDDAIEAAEIDRSGQGRDMHANDQLVEVETGRMRPISKVVISTLGQIGMVAAGDTSAAAAQMQCAWWMIHETPRPQVAA